MAIVAIDVTTPQPNGKFGDPNRTAFEKINSNFAEVAEDLGSVGTVVAEVEALKVEIEQEVAAAMVQINTEVTEALAEIDQEITDLEASIPGLVNTAIAGRIPGKNYLINGDFRFWQRSQTSAAAAARRYVADRWEVWSIGSTSAVDAMTLNDGNILPPVRFAHRVIVNTVAGAGNFAFLRQHIEGVRTLSGEQVTVSMRMYSLNAGFIAVNLSQNFGAGGSAIVDVAGQKIAVVSGWQTVTATFTLPAVTGKTVGTSDSLILQIWLDAGANYNTQTGTLGQRSGTYWFANVQLEVGGSPTKFEYRPDAEELALCQRYYEKSYDPATSPGAGATVGYASALLAASGYFLSSSPTFKVPKRALPAVIAYRYTDGVAGSLDQYGTTGSLQASIPASITNISVSGFEMRSNGAGVAGNAIRYHWAADSEL